MFAKVVLAALVLGALASGFMYVTNPEFHDRADTVIAHVKDHGLVIDPDRDGKAGVATTTTGLAVVVDTTPTTVAS